MSFFAYWVLLAHRCVKAGTAINDCGDASATTAQHGRRGQRIGKTREDKAGKLAYIWPGKLS